MTSNSPIHEDILRKLKTDAHREFKEISPSNNIYYLPNNIDIRICPKNGMSTWKTVTRVIYERCPQYIEMGKQMLKQVPHDIGSYMYRRKCVKQWANSYDLPFRKGSIRIAIRRDPVDRFKSACDFVIEQRLAYMKHGVNLPDITEDVDLVIDALKNDKIRDPHFYTQTYYMGQKEDYDMVFHIDEMHKSLSYIEEILGLKKFTICGIHQNPTTKKLYNEALTDDHIDVIMDVYNKDYKNGWCKLDESL